MISDNAKARKIKRDFIHLGIKTRHDNVDIVICRQNTEGKQEAKASRLVDHLMK